ncbi:hypothetical protein J14TS2_00860 [Bacillus sp. J14TS2]|uniref:hypothetical protein n=1 Tax=Bacillus sp. J14TS2 TaxID=2807188 RepID=UPI001B21A693|nr:hypothetical protein [Bacillus sp. J14TS2]GIN69611.1 hypothetical protein J14TS2_00860 [Bacillus sp. J14TS2]
MIDLYNVENSMVYDKNLVKGLMDFPFTQETHENRDTYESDNNQDEPLSSKDVIQKAFIDIVFFERVHRVAYKKVMADSEYRTVDEVSDQLFSQLKESLSEEQKKLLLELETAWSSKYLIFLEYCYRQGLADSQMIHKELEKFGISVVKENLEYNYIPPESVVLS